MPSRPLIMGVLNVTPNSFSDGGLYADTEAAVAHGLALMADGADIIDVGGEATNPRAQPVSAEEELARVVPVVARLVAAGARVSIDTTKAVVARAAVVAGAQIINDISGGLFDPEMAGAIGDATYIAGHVRGGSIAEVFAREAIEAGAALTWDVVADELMARLAALPEPARARAWVDPGLGFGKGANPETNMSLLRRAGDLGARLGRPVVIGASRKRFVRRAFGVRDDDSPAIDARHTTRGGGNAPAPPAVTGREGPLAIDRASCEVSVEAARAGANVLRVHNVALLRAALAL